MMRMQKINHYAPTKGRTITDKSLLGVLGIPELMSPVGGGTFKVNKAKGMVKKKTVLFRKTAAAVVIVSLIMLCLTGCSSNSGKLAEGLTALETNTITRTDSQDSPDAQTIEQSQTESALRLKTADIQNNGTSVVRWNGNDYYWKYNADSVSADGLFASFPFREGSINQMICRHPDGQEEVLFEMDWSGSIFLAGNRMYLEKAAAAGCVP